MELTRGSFFKFAGEEYMTLRILSQKAALTNHHIHTHTQVGGGMVIFKTQNCTK